jgi:hypothetical protein
MTVSKIVLGLKGKQPTIASCHSTPLSDANPVKLGDSGEGIGQTRRKGSPIHRLIDYHRALTGKVTLDLAIDPDHLARTSIEYLEFLPFTARINEVSDS